MRGFSELSTMVFGKNGDCLSNVYPLLKFEYLSEKHFIKDGKQLVSKDTPLTCSCQVVSIESSNNCGESTFLSSKRAKRDIDKNMEEGKYLLEF